MSSRVVDPRKEALYEYGMQVLNNKNNADEELKDRGKALMARYVDEVIRGQIAAESICDPELMRNVSIYLLDE